MSGENCLTRRGVLRTGGIFLAAASAARPADGFRPLFDEVSLKGWKRSPRALNQPSLGIWTVEDGVLSGGQDPPGSGIGSYLVSDETFGDFELLIDARPDWPADTGVLVRTNAQGNVGYQVLIDHRLHGGIGGYYGNGIGNWHAWDYSFTAEKDSDGKVVRLIPGPAVEPTTANFNVPLDYSAHVEEFLRIWKPGGWNTFRIRCTGEVPHLTTWINGVKIAELDTAKMKAPKWDPKAVVERLGTTGHIALEVHSNGPNDKLGKYRWAPGAVCRWRNISVKTL
jgi:Domain of Unknown Function (DUF1080)